MVHKQKALCLHSLVGVYPFAPAIPSQMNNHRHCSQFYNQFGPSSSYCIYVDVADGLPQAPEMCSCLHRALRFLLHSFSCSLLFPLVAEHLVRHHKLLSKSQGRPCYEANSVYPHTVAHKQKRNQSPISPNIHIQCHLRNHRVSCLAYTGATSAYTGAGISDFLERLKWH